MIVHRSLSYRLRLTAAQAGALDQFAGVCRLVYNLAWEQRRDFWRQYKAAEGRHITYFSQSAELTALRRDVDWIAAVPSDCQLQALRDLDRACAAFFAGRAGYPSPRKRGVNDGIAFRGREIAIRRLNRKWAEVRLPKLGYVKARWTRDLIGDVRNVRLTRERGSWRLTIQVRGEAPEAPTLPDQVGIDRGVAQTLTLSNGETFQAPKVASVMARKARAQRVLSRRKRGSGRYWAQQRRVADLSAQAARKRTDWCHRTSTAISGRFGLVALESLNIGNMVRSARGTVDQPGRGVRQKAGLNRSILEQCWGRFADQLAYKLEERGGVLISVPPQFTSQTCAECGVVDARSRKSQAVFECIACGHADNADINAAREILRRSTSGLGVEGWRSWPAEASTEASAQTGGAGDADPLPKDVEISR